MSDDVPNLRMLRDQQTASDAEYIAQLEGLTEGLERQVQVANDAADAAAEAVGAMAEKTSALIEDNDRLRRGIAAACEELDEFAARTGHGDIGLIVERLLAEDGVPYPADERFLAVEADRDRLAATIRGVLDGLAGPESEDAVAALTAEQVDTLRAAVRDVTRGEVHGELIVRMRESVWNGYNAERDRLRTVVDAAISYIFALEGQSETVVVRARRDYEAALAALDPSSEGPDG